jgi:hypothetical protein
VTRHDALPPPPRASHAPPYAPQAIAQLAAMFPSLPASVVADALGSAGGDVPRAVDALLQAAQVRA